MMKRFLYVILLALPLQLSAAKISLYDLKTENLANPMGLDTTVPRFSWKINASERNLVQTSYQILVASSKVLLDRNEGDLWNSGEVQSADQLWIPYKGTKLISNQRAYWKVRIVTNKGRSDWSAAQSFSVGLLNETKWKGQWIGLEGLQPGEQTGLHTRLAARYLRKDYQLSKAVKRATAYVAGLGLYQFYVNGWKLGDDQVLTPVPSDYRKTIYYNTYDITPLLAKDNALGIVLGNGRYFPMRQEKAYKAPVFGFPTCRINVIIEYEDGTTDTWFTDQTWKITTEGPIRSNNEYDGEEYDARLELGGWSVFGYDDHSWRKAERSALPEGTLRGQMTPNMVEEAYGYPLTIKPLEDGRTIIDFGQNMAGWIGFRPKGNKGDTIRVKYAERLNEDGTLYLANLRNALSEDIYVCNGKENGSVLWRPVFSYHGFRYAMVTGLKNAKREDFMAYTVNDPMTKTGALSTSDTILNKVVRNAWWGIKSNYKGMPVDCPQRNERQPWLGDRASGCWGESFLFDNERLYAKWMKDLVDGQRADGAFSNVTPSFWNYFDDNMTWPSVFPFACDMLYEQFGNKQPIIDAYPSIKKWLYHMLEEYEVDGIITKDKYGDWCMPPEKLELIHSQDPARQTDGQLISTAYGIKILQLMEKFARMQGLTEDAKVWNEADARLKNAFNKKFLTYKPGTSVRPGHVLYPDSIFYGNNTATANLLPLAFGIVPENAKEEVVKNLITNIMTVGNGHITTGIIGASWLMRGLSDNGFADVAWLLATNKTYPSWGYMAENGATTIWELWNGDKANPAMNSGNHVMLLGDLLTWCYQYLGGIRALEPGYKRIELKPSFEIQDCFSIDASFDSPYGKIGSKWNKTLENVHWEVSIPANTMATIHFPDGHQENVGSGDYTYNIKIPASNAAIVKDEFLYNYASFPQCHASTITELKNGDLVAAYFGGKHENNPDVCIWVSRKPHNASTWEKPILAGDGVFELGSPDALLAGMDDSATDAKMGPVLPYHHGNLKRKACWNPVLFTMPDGEIWLFYKIGKRVSDWTGWVVKSRDGGKTWSKREPLPKGFIGPVKNKPELIDGKLICGSSTEVNGWKFHVEIYDLKTRQWQYVGPVPAVQALKTDDKKMHPIDCIQPSILKLKDGRLQVLMRSHSGKLATSFSSDNGLSWTDVTLSEMPNNQSGTDAVTLRDGRHVLVYNDFETIPGQRKGPRTPLSIAISDDGQCWRHVLTLEDSPISQYSYPAIIEGKDGCLHCVYTWRRQRVAYKKIDLSKLK